MVNDRGSIANKLCSSLSSLTFNVQRENLWLCYVKIQLILALQVKKYRKAFSESKAYYYKDNKNREVLLYCVCLCVLLLFYRGLYSADDIMNEEMQECSGLSEGWAKLVDIDEARTSQDQEKTTLRSSLVAVADTRCIPQMDDDSESEMTRLGGSEKLHPIKEPTLPVTDDPIPEEPDVLGYRGGEVHDNTHPIPEEPAVRGYREVHDHRHPIPEEPDVLGYRGGEVHDHTHPIPEEPAVRGYREVRDVGHPMPKKSDLPCYSGEVQDHRHPIPEETAVLGYRGGEVCDDCHPIPRQNLFESCLMDAGDEHNRNMVVQKPPTLAEVGVHPKGEEQKPLQRDLFDPCFKDADDEHGRNVSTPEPPPPPRLSRQLKKEEQKPHKQGRDSRDAEARQREMVPSQTNPFTPDYQAENRDDEDLGSWCDMNAALDEEEFSEALVQEGWETVPQYKIMQPLSEWRRPIADPSCPLHLDSVPDPAGGYRQLLTTSNGGARPFVGVRHGEFKDAEPKSCDFRAVAATKQAFPERGKVRKEVFPGLTYMDIEPVREQKRKLEQIEMQALEEDVRTFPPWRAVLKPGKSSLSAQCGQQGEEKRDHSPYHGEPPYLADIQYHPLSSSYVIKPNLGESGHPNPGSGNRRVHFRQSFHESTSSSKSMGTQPGSASDVPVPEESWNLQPQYPNPTGRERETQLHFVAALPEERRVSSSPPRVTCRSSPLTTVKSDAPDYCIHFPEEERATPDPCRVPSRSHNQYGERENSPDPSFKPPEKRESSLNLNHKTDRSYAGSATRGETNTDCMVTRVARREGRRAIPQRVQKRSCSTYKRREDGSSHTYSISDSEAPSGTNFRPCSQRPQSVRDCQRSSSSYCTDMEDSYPCDPRSPQPWHRSPKRTKEPPKYQEGKSDVEDFLVQFNLVCKCNEWSYRDAGFELASSLEEDVRSVINSLPQSKQCDYDSLCLALRKQFQHPRDAQEDHDSMQLEKRRVSYVLLCMPQRSCILYEERDDSPDSNSEFADRRMISSNPRRRPKEVRFQQEDRDYDPDTAYVLPDGRKFSFKPDSRVGRSYTASATRGGHDTDSDHILSGETKHRTTPHRMTREHEKPGEHSYYQTKNNRAKRTRTRTLCYNCRKRGHIAKLCPRSSTRK